MSCNNGTIVGTIVSDIEEKASGDLVIANFRLAPTVMGEKDSPLPVTAYNQVATRILDRYNKGDLVSISFRLRYNTWQTAEGEPRGRMEVIANTCDTLRLGQISQAKRQEAEPAPAAATRIVRKIQPTQSVTVEAEVVREPSLDEIPF
jgi:single-stranded DNA-binding protein